MVKVRVKGFRVFTARVLGYGFFLVVFAGQILHSCMQGAGVEEGCQSVGLDLPGLAAPVSIVVLLQRAAPRGVCVRCIVRRITKPKQRIKNIVLNYVAYVELEFVPALLLLLLL